MAEEKRLAEEERPRPPKHSVKLSNFTIVLTLDILSETDKVMYNYLEPIYELANLEVDHVGKGAKSDEDEDEQPIEDGLPDDATVTIG